MRAWREGSAPLVTGIAVAAVMAVMTAWPAAAIPGTLNAPASPIVDYTSTTSQIVVSGQSAAINDVNVTISGLSHEFPADLDVLLEGPTGVKVMLVSDASAGADCGADAVNVTLTFDDAAAGPVPADGFATGSFRPGNTVGACAGDPDDAKVPAPTAAALSAFNGTSSNGTWTLHLGDDGFGDIGSIAGWSLSLDPLTGACGGKLATIVGNGKANVLTGTAGDDVIAAGAGADLVRGRGGNDLICGGPGRDVLRGGAGDDTIFGDSRRDILRGGAGFDTCRGGSATDTFATCEVKVQ